MPTTDPYIALVAAESVALGEATGRAQARQAKRADAVCVFSGSPMFRGSGIIITSEP